MAVVIGLDCGGTSTKAVVAPQNSDFSLHRSKIPGLVVVDLESANFAQRGSEGLREIAGEALKGARYTFPSESEFLIFAGVAGVETPADKLACEQSLNDIGFKRSIVENDCGMLNTALGGDSIVVVAGTGSNCFGRKGQQVFQDGGWGHFLGSDPGSGYDIGEKAICAAIALDAKRLNAPDTILLQSIKKCFDIDDLKDLISKVYHPQHISNTAVVASVAPLVFEAAKYGDLVANLILKNAAEELGRQAYNVYEKLQLDNPTIGLQGSIVNNPHSDEYYIRHFAEVFNWFAVSPSFKHFGTEPGQVDPLLGVLQHAFPEN